MRDYKSFLIKGKIVLNSKNRKQSPLSAYLLAISRKGKPSLAVRLVRLSMTLKKISGQIEPGIALLNRILEWLKSWNERVCSRPGKLLESREHLDMVTVKRRG